MTGNSHHSREFRDKVAKEAIESQNSKATAKKYELKVSNVYNWVKSYRRRELNKDDKSIKDYQKIIDDKDLEIQILKELLKKTTVALVPDMKSLKLSSSKDTQ